MGRVGLLEDGRLARAAILGHLGLVDYREAWALQQSLAAAVTRGALPDTVLVLEHPPTVTLGRRTDPGELHLPDGAEVAVVATDRGGKSTYHGPGQLVCYPILDLNRHGRDVRGYCRALEEAIIATVGTFGLAATTIDGLTGVWVDRAAGPAKIASIGVHIRRWVTTHGYALNVDLDPAPFSTWITACGLQDAAFTALARELDQPVSVDDVAPVAADALAEAFGLAFTRRLAGDPASWPAPLRDAIAAGAPAGLVALRD